MGRTRGDTSLVVWFTSTVTGSASGSRPGNGSAWSLRSDKAVGNELREWATALDTAGRRSLKAVVDRVAGAIDGEARIVGAMPDLGFELRRLDGKILLPLRPVLLGGDDLTFLCDGRVALHLAEVALDAFSGDVANLGSVTASAGVALVPAHTPFDRAYELAEVLCGNAKARRRERNDIESWLDWHIGVPRPGEGVDDLRERAFTHRLGNLKLQLTCRPYRMGRNATDRETWRWLARTIIGSGQDGFRGERWRRHRNKVKELASVAREGHDGVRRARESWTVASGLTWPGRPRSDERLSRRDTHAPSDAIELLDIHLPLAEESAS